MLASVLLQLLQYSRKNWNKLNNDPKYVNFFRKNDLSQMFVGVLNTPVAVTPVFNKIQLHTIKPKLNVR